jgi:hypothetical protein
MAWREKSDTILDGVAHLSKDFAESRKRGKKIILEGGEQDPGAFQGGLGLGSFDGRLGLGGVGWGRRG